jgi:glycosyltransferase involved in cell wall biosynthesis
VSHDSPHALLRSDEGAALISVVIPLFNKAQFVEAAVESVLRQTVSDFEVVIVDDGSTDGGAEVAQRCADRRVRLVAQSNAGVSAARNRGTAEARGDWVAFLDADDLWFPTHLEELRRIAVCFPDCGLIATAYSEGLTPSVPKHDRRPARIERINYLREAARKISIVWSSAAAARRDALQAVGGFPPFTIGEDLACWVALALRYPVGYSHAVTAFYRRGTDGAMEQDYRRAVNSPDDRTHVAPRPLEDLGPCVAVLCRDGGGEAANLSRSDVDEFINSRLRAAIISDLALGRYASAQSWSRTLISRSRRAPLLPACVAGVPLPLLRAAITSAVASRRAARSLRATLHAAVIRRP